MELIVSSICPNIFGHDYVKFGLTLALFGSFVRCLRGSSLVSAFVRSLVGWCVRSLGVVLLLFIGSLIADA